MPQTLLLVDAYSQIYRAFYAIRKLTGPQRQPVNAIFGFTKMLRKQLADHQPSHVAVVYDLGAPAGRLALLPSYKEHRPPTPPLLDQQLPCIREVLRDLGIPVLEQEKGQEADDLIATIARQAAADDCRVLIATNDKDLAQIVSDRILLLRPAGKETVLVDPAKVLERYGVRPEQMVDLLSLTGDAVDGIPGVPGIGPKTAIELLRQYGSLDQLLAHAAELPRPRLAALLQEHGARARQNRDLIRLHTDLQLPVRWRQLLPQPPNTARLQELYRECGFKTLLAELTPATNVTGDLFRR